VWRNRDAFVTGRAAIVEFLTKKWQRELDYALRKELWAFDGNRISVRFQYESHDTAGQWWRSYGNEQWEFDENGLMIRREASTNDVPIDQSERRIFQRHGVGVGFVVIPRSIKGDRLCMRQSSHVSGTLGCLSSPSCRIRFRGPVRWRSMSVTLPSV
jgi:hypothetical protein